ncbi:MAG: GWxTD domain-containing protein [Candidatus Zhuqueibacterota bacterium]
MKRISPQIIFLTYLLLLIFPAQTAASEKTKRAEAHYQQAVSFYQQSNRDSALHHLKKAISLNRKHAKAYHQLAVLFMDEGTVHGRFKATFEMERALKLEPNNPEFRYSCALLNLKKGLTFEARRQFEKIVEADPYHYQAYFQLAALEEDQVMAYKDMISIDPDLDGIIFMQSFALQAQQKAADYFRQAISANPHFTTAYYRLALLYFEFQQLEHMIQLLESAVKIMPTDKNCHLFLGFAYQHSRRYAEAEREYHLARSLMTHEEESIFESVEPILSPTQLKQLQRPGRPADTDSLLENVWMSKDPLFLTEFNERKLEHFSRVAYANLRYSFPDRGIEGWQTDRGKVLIRYGSPAFKYRTRPYIGAFVGGTRNPLHHSKEYWIYSDFHFIFEDQYLSGNFAFAWEDGTQPDFKYVYEEMIKDRPDFYQVHPDSEMFDVPMEIAAFKGATGKTELEIYYGIPAGKIRMKQQQFHLKQGVFFFDPDWKPVVNSRADLFLTHGDLIEVDNSAFGVGRFQAVLAPGDYFFAMEFLDQNSRQSATVHQEVAIDSFFADRFQMSHVLFAHDLNPPRTDSLPTRADFHIIPNPLKTYGPGQPVILYYEIYGLSQDNFGASRYSIEYKIGQDSKSIPGWRKFFTELKLLKKRGEVTSSYEYAGNSRDDIQYQRIILPPDLVGRVQLIIQITDLIGNATIQRQELVTVIDRKK